MKVWNVYDDEIKALAAEVGLRVRGGEPKREGRAYRFRLALDDPLPSGGFRFQKIDGGGYGTSHVCWHGIREFLYALFQQFPEAIVDTAFDRYHGAAEFHHRYVQTRDMSIDGYVSNQGRCRCQPIRRRLRPPISTYRRASAQLRDLPTPIREEPVSIEISPDERGDLVARFLESLNTVQESTASAGTSLSDTAESFDRLTRVRWSNITTEGDSTETP